MSVRSLSVAVCLAAAALATPVEAATLFRLFGDANGDFTLPARPTPDSFTSDYFVLAPRPGQLNGAVSTFSFYFYVAGNGGGFDMTDDIDTDNLVQLGGLQLFRGPTSAPRFVEGTYLLTRFANQADPGSFTLTIAGVPEPANWALLIAGFGLTGAALRQRRAATASLAAA